MLRAVVGLLAVSACAARTTPVATAPLRDDCRAPARWDGRACRAPGAAADEIERGAAALAAFDVATALPLLEAARGHGPLTHAENVRLHEQLGIAYAYLGRELDAERAFERLLRLDPGHLLSYTLSPKATFVFERVRERVRAQAAPAVDVAWPRQQDVSRPLRFEVEVDSDPRAQFASAALRLREDAAAPRLVPVTLPAVGGFAAVQLPPLGGARPRVLDVALTVYDRDGNEVLRWGDAARREVEVGYRPPVAWHRRWWVWAIAGAAVASATGAVVWWIVDEPASRIGGTVEF